jgi:nitrite reductase/ring-hydroxylating ferredoxin subunit
MAVMLCLAGDIDPETGKEVFVDGPDGRMCIALFQTGKSLRAYLNVCPHQGRSLSLAPDEFLFTGHGDLVCPHHGACFRPVTGECVSGPCEGSFLTPVAIEVKGGCVYLRHP